MFGGSVECSEGLWALVSLAPNLQPSKLRTLSIVLFIASLLSIFSGIMLWGLLMQANGLMQENMWTFFLMTPIPISSIILGFILRAKGYKYKKNIIAGFIMTFFLCIYGSFVFMV